MPELLPCRPTTRPEGFHPNDSKPITGRQNEYVLPTEDTAPLTGLWPTSDDVYRFNEDWDLPFGSAWDVWEPRDSPTDAAMRGGASQTSMPSEHEELWGSHDQPLLTQTSRAAPFAPAPDRQAPRSTFNVAGFITGTVKDLCVPASEISADVVTSTPLESTLSRSVSRF